MTSVPKAVRMFVGVLCAVVLLSALGMTVAALMLSPKPVWVLFGFEVVIAAAAVLGILFGLGRFQDGQGLALACVAGTIAVGSFLGWIGADKHLLTAKADMPLTTWLMGRIGAAVALGLVGALLVLSRNPRSWPYLMKSAMAGVPLLVVLGAFAAKRGAVTAMTTNLPGWLLGVVCVLGGLVAIVLTSASVHCLIRAFELGRTDPQA